MKNAVQNGEIFTFTAVAAVASGAGVLAGAVFGVAQNAAAIGEPVELKRRGIFTLPKNNAEAWTVGAKVYWDNTAKVLTTTVGSNTLVGAAAAVAANPTATGIALLDGTIR